MTTVAIHRTQDGVLTSADSATVSITSQAGVVVLPTTTVVPVSAGVYSYTTTPLTPGNYTALWTFSVTGYPADQVSRVFQVETPVTVEEGLTLMEVERAIAARIGPYFKQIAGAGNSATGVVVNKLRTSLDIGDYESLFLLRRGVFSDGSLVPNFTEDDRHRIVASYTSIDGRLTPDRPWTLIPQIGEVIELHYFDPDDLREIALQGLRRCFFWDTLSTTQTSYIGTLNLTQIAPWIVDERYIRRVEAQSSGLNIHPQALDWFEPYREGGQVHVRTISPFRGTLNVELLRPHFTWVNDQDTPGGPNHDLDTLRVDREYAARAGHISAWMLQRPRMMPVAAQGLAISMEEAAKAFTVTSMKFAKTSGERIQHRFTRGVDFTQVGNL